MERATSTRGLKGLLTAMVVAVCASAALTVWAQPRPHGEGREGPPPPGMAGMMLMGPPEHVERAVGRLLDSVKATDGQRKQVQQIAQAAAKDVQAQMEAGRGLRERGRTLFTAPTIDEAAIESLRQQMTRQHDAVSKRTSQAMVEIAKVLTPEQRKSLAERFERRRERREDRGDEPRPPRGGDQGAIPSTVPMT